MTCTSGSRPGESHLQWTAMGRSGDANDASLLVHCRDGLRRSFGHSLDQADASAPFDPAAKAQGHSAGLTIALALDV